MECRHCKAQNPPEALLCYQCGQPLETAATPSRPRLPGLHYTFHHKDPHAIPAWMWEQHRDLLDQLNREQVPEDRQVWLKRLLATMVDHILLVLAFFSMILLAELITGIALPHQQTGLWVQLSVIFLLVHYLYTLLFQTFYAGTPGYWLVRLAVARELDPNPVLDIKTVSVRWFYLIMTTLFFGLDLWWSLFDRNHRFFHDRATRTRTVAWDHYNRLLDIQIKE